LKGGCGKSMGAYSIGSHCGQTGRRTILIDADPQGSLGSSFWSPTITDSLPANRTLATLFDTTAPPPRPADIIHPTGVANVSVVPANLHLAQYNLNTPDPRVVHCIAQFLDEISNNYDICIIDTPPSMQQLTVVAMTGSHWCVAPVQAEQPAVQGLSHLFRTVDAVRSNSNSQLQVLGILITMYDGRLALHRAMREVLCEQYGDLIFKQSVPLASAYKESVIKMTPVTVGAPRSLAAAAIRRLVDEIDARVLSNGQG
jgi:chromosome partitioning protein